MCVHPTQSQAGGRLVMVLASRLPGRVGTCAETLRTVTSVASAELGQHFPVWASVCPSVKG